MNNLYARSVFFVQDAERSLRFYVEQLGFAEDWNYREDGRTFVSQVSLFGFELILNQIHDATRVRAGHGRVFIGLDDDQLEPLRAHIASTGIKTGRLDWGRQTLVMRDLDGNEIFFWLPHDDFTGIEIPALDANAVTEVTQ
jgi:catechol 2,3-dioxygenase-like lactoylglutathione lyase family enzyme